MKHRFLLFICFAFALEATFAQSGSVPLAPYSRWNEAQYYQADLPHTAFRYHLYNDTLPQRGKGCLIKRKIMDEHLLNFNHDNFNLYVDFLPDFQIGVDKGSNKHVTLWEDTRGFKVSGNVGKKLYFETEVYETQEKLPFYVDSAAAKIGSVPRYIGNYHPGANTTSTLDINYSSARIVYIPTDFLQFELGYGRNFIGDGYRSLLLSDWAFNYPYLRATGQFGQFEYSAMWSQYLNPQDTGSTAQYGITPRKWAQTFYLDWHFAKKGNVGLMESVVWADASANGSRDIAPTLFSPIIFLHGTHTPSGIDNYTLTGLNAKYEFARRTFVYGQFAYSNFLRSDWTKRYAFQLGLRSASVFGVKGLNFVGEYNMAKAYMYAGNAYGINYAQYNQPLADPYGANFKEVVGVLNYQIKRWWFRLEGIYSSYMNDANIDEDCGSNILLPLPTSEQAAGGGVRTHVGYGNLRVAFMLNPKINLRIEGGVTLRRQSDVMGNSTHDNVFELGLRASFRDLIEDF